MKKLLAISILILSFTLCLYPQKPDSLWNQDQVSNATVMLYQQITKDTAKLGSGTIVSYDDRYFILTATHVAKDLLKTAKIVFRLPDDKPGIFNLLSLTKTQHLNWHNHPIAYMSMMELFPRDNVVKKILQTWSFPIKQIYGSKTLPSRDADLTFLGFPLLDLEMEHFSPLIFTGYLASGLITQLRADTKTKCSFFYLNVPSIQGCSGSGVYFSIKKGMYYGGGVTLLIGIVHGTESDNTGGKLAAITPSYYINDLLKEF